MKAKVIKCTYCNLSYIAFLRLFNREMGLQRIHSILVNDSGSLTPPARSTIGTLAKMISHLFFA